MRSMLYYEVEITRFFPTLNSTRLVTESPADVMAAISPKDNEELCILIAALSGGVDFGNFIIFLNKDHQCYVILHEHREIFPTAKFTAADPDALIYFRDEPGAIFSVKQRNTLTMETAFAALTYWLPEQKYFPSLDWN
jgi:hypothetical protein